MEGNAAISKPLLFKKKIATLALQDVGYFNQCMEQLMIARNDGMWQVNQSFLKNT